MFCVYSMTFVCFLDAGNSGPSPRQSRSQCQTAGQGSVWHCPGWGAVSNGCPGSWSPSQESSQVKQVCAWNYVLVRGGIKKFVDWHCTILVSQSILLIFTLTIIAHKFNKHFKFHREINQGIKWILSTESKVSQPCTVLRVPLDDNNVIDIFYNLFL